MKCLARVVVVGMGLLAAGCGSSNHGAAADAGGDASGPAFTELSVPTRPPTDLDLLFVIDDSPSMADKQANLATSFPAFLDALSSLPGGLPNLHIGVVTTDLGTKGALDAAPGPAIGVVDMGGCSGTGKGGALQKLGAPITGTFISDVAGPGGTRITNYPSTMTLAQVFATMTRAGDVGCGFEQPLEAMKQALTIPGNTGFLRADAALGVVFVTDEDDCSLAHSTLLAAGEATLGPLQSFRCTRFGVTCETGGKTSDDMNTIGSKGKCHASTDPTYLTNVTAYATFLHGLKRDPAQVAATALAGATSPFAVELRAPPGSPAQIPALAHSCTYTDTLGHPEVADPPVRITSFLDALRPSHGRTTSICQLNLAPELADAGVQILAAMGDPCFRARLLDTDPATAGVQANCTVTVDGTTLPVCTGSNAPCYAIAEDGLVCGRSATLGSEKLAIDGADQLPAAAHIVARCELAPTSD